MRVRTFIILLAACSLVSPTMARAQTVPAEPPPFDWQGPYAGVGFGVFGLSGFLDLYAPAIHAGYNVRFGRFLASVEAHADVGFPGPVFEADLATRIGFLLGYRDRGLYYLEGGIGYAYGGPIWLATFGHEIAISERTTVFGEVKVYLDFAPSVRGMTVQIGANRHFDQ